MRHAIALLTLCTLTACAEVREYTGWGGDSGSTYQQQISRHISQSAEYPRESRLEGEVMLRLRIDRAGEVRMVAVEKSSGNKELDAAALELVRKSSPLPPIPDGMWPDAQLAEFIIPVTFRPSAPAQ